MAPFLVVLLGLCLALWTSIPSSHESLFALADCTTYTLKSGGTCYAKISQQAHGIPLSRNATINCENLQINQTVCVSKSSSRCTAYTIKSGDACYANISQPRGIHLSGNASINCNTVQKGQIVCMSKPSSSSASTHSVKSNRMVFREYIGAQFDGVHFSDVPINDAVTFHFIIAFAIDYTEAGDPTDGVFNVFWQDSVITPDAVSAIKAQHPNVMVMLSLGGDTVNNMNAQFHPTSVSSWVANAVSSLTSLINQYQLDGIDIDYEHFDNAGVTPHKFASCIGQLIQQLKANGVISVASIAPYDDLERYYKALWGQYGHLIDYVNFQFYTYDPSTTASEYMHLYNAAAAKYGGGTVLASFDTPASDYVGPPPDTVLSACQQLKANGNLPGIFVYSADGSYTSSQGFQYERRAQSLLAS